MSRLRTLSVLAGGVALASLAAGEVTAQPGGRAYVFHSPPTNGCPGLDWHIVVTQNQLEGMVAWDSMKHLAHVEGTLGADRRFHMNAQEVRGGNRTAVIDGQVAGDGWMTIVVTGTGTGCDGKQINVPVYRPGPEGSG